MDHPLASENACRFLSQIRESANGGFGSILLKNSVLKRAAILFAI